MPNKSGNKKSTSPKVQKSNCKGLSKNNNKVQKSKTPKSKRVSKIIQGGGYYNSVGGESVPDMSTSQSGGVILSGNTLMYVIIGLLIVIGVLVYMNMKQSE